MENQVKVGLVVLLPFSISLFPSIVTQFVLHPHTCFPSSPCLCLDKII